jgi:hypothetical protein
MEAGDTQIMIAGNLGDDPQLRFTRLGSRPRRSASRPPRGTSTRATFAKSLQHGDACHLSGRCGSGRTRPGRARSGPSTRWTRTTSLYRSAGRRSRSPRRHAQLPVPPNPPGIPTRGRVRPGRLLRHSAFLSPPSTESCRCFPRSVRLHYTGMPAVRVIILKYEVCRHGRGNLREAYRRIGDPASDAGRHHPPGRGMPL